MEIDVLRSTENPERLVCQAARGDYYGGYVGDTAYAELMKGVDYDKSNVSVEELDRYENEWHCPSVVEEKTRSFIEKQLSRGHYGPWEHPQITFAVKGVSRVTMAQITRHRHMTFDVQSQRYVDFSETDAVVPATLLSNDDRHERYPHIYDEDGEHFNRDEGHFDMSEEKRDDWRAMYRQKTAEQLDLYEDMVDAGIPKEDARFVLPVGTPVNMTFSGNARTFMHLLDMRKKANAQWEIHELSNLIIEELMNWMPHTYNHYDKNAPHKLSP